MGEQQFGPCPAGVAFDGYRPDPTSATGKRGWAVKCGAPIAVRKGEGRWVCEAHHPLGGGTDG